MLYEEFVQQREMHEYRLPNPLHVATLEAEEVFRYRITNELTVMTPYDIPREYAEVLDGAATNGQRCFNGIMYRARFDPRLQPRALALFDEEGEKDWVSCTPNDLNRSLIDQLKNMGIDIEVADIPPTDVMR
ncbi:hypothetical protein [Streptomyces sp. NPDC006140]|uniref:hypothetical protein n=1 Tax=Streptomyces sp. NPDC006140 TaxID=3154579 RepID=UPI00340ED693